MERKDLYTTEGKRGSMVSPRSVLMALLMSMLFVGVAYADFAYSPVNVFVPSSTAFTVTIIGIGAVTSNASYCNAAMGCPGTSTIYFNATASTQTNVLPCTGIGGTNCETNGASPAPGNPIINITNTGTIPFNVSMRFNNTVATGVTFWTNSTCAGAGCGAAYTDGAGKTIDNSANVVICTAVPFTNGWCNVWLFANLSACPGGLYTNQLFYNTTVGASS